MNTIISAVILAVSLLSAMPALAKEPIRIIDGIVTKISDGDTIHVKDNLGSKVKVRLYGIDAPETEKSNKKTGHISNPGQRFGEESHRALQGKLKRQRVRLEVRDIDRHGRLVSIVWLGNRNINREMVADGWAWAFRKYLDRAHASEYIEAEEQARKKRLGLWEEYNPVPPWEFRKSLREGNRHID